MSIFSRKPKTEDKKVDKAMPIKIAEKEIKKDKILNKNYKETYKHLIKPITTEKSSLLNSLNQYIFEVAPKSNKSEIKKAIENLYGVKPIKINIIKKLGKKIRQGRNFGKMKNWKKAVVILKAEDKIEVYKGT